MHASHRYLDANNNQSHFTVPYATFLWRQKAILIGFWHSSQKKCFIVKKILKIPSNSVKNQLKWLFTKNWRCCWRKMTLNVVNWRHMTSKVIWRHINNAIFVLSNPALKLFSFLASFKAWCRLFQNGITLFMKNWSLSIEIFAGSLWKHFPPFLTFTSI